MAAISGRGCETTFQNSVKSENIENKKTSKEQTPSELEKMLYAWTIEGWRR